MSTAYYADLKTQDQLLSFKPLSQRVRIPDAQAHDAHQPAPISPDTIDLSLEYYPTAHILSHDMAFDHQASKDSQILNFSKPITQI